MIDGCLSVFGVGVGVCCCRWIVFLCIFLSLVSFKGYMLGIRLFLVMAFSDGVFPKPELSEYGV